FSPVTLAYGGLRSRDHWRRIERRQHRARRRWPGLARHPAGTGRSRRGCLLGLAAADPRRSRGPGAPAFSSRPFGADRARRLAQDRAASGAPDALCDPCPFGRTGLAVALMVAAI